MNSIRNTLTRTLSALGVLTACAFAPSAQALECNDMWNFMAKTCNRISDTARTGQSELLVSGYAWHDPHSYSADHLAAMNQNAWGIGYAKTKDDTDGDSHTVFALGFLDSHKAMQWQAGYLWQTYLGKTGGPQVGAGLATMVVQRPDIFKGIPFPAIWPMASIRYNDFNIYGTFMPKMTSTLNNGNVAYVFGGYRF